MFWDDHLQQELRAPARARQHELCAARMRALESHQPRPPEWRVTGAVERAYAVASPLVARYAHGLVHGAEGVDPSRVFLVLNTAPWIAQTTLRSSDDVAAEVRRAAILLDAVVRTFIPAIYEAEGAAGEAAAFRELPVLYTCRAVVIAMKMVIATLEAELRNIARRRPYAQHVFVTVLKDAATMLVEFDYLVRAARSGAKLPIGGSLSLASRVLRVFGWARRVPATQETLDDYAIAVIGLMVQLDASMLPDLFGASDAGALVSVRSEGGA